MSRGLIQPCSKLIHHRKKQTRCNPMMKLRISPEHQWLSAALWHIRYERTVVVHEDQFIAQVLHHWKQPLAHHSVTAFRPQTSLSNQHRVSFYRFIWNIKNRFVELNEINRSVLSPMATESLKQSLQMVLCRSVWQQRFLGDNRCSSGVDGNDSAAISARANRHCESCSSRSIDHRNRSVECSLASLNRWNKLSVERSFLSQCSQRTLFSRCCSIDIAVARVSVSRRSIENLSARSSGTPQSRGCNRCGRRTTGRIETAATIRLDREWFVETESICRQKRNRNDSLIAMG